MTQHAHAATADTGATPGRHVVSPGLYVAIFLALMALTAITVGVAFLNLGPFNTLVALLIACTKMMLVVLYFMHVRYSSRLTWAVVGAGFFWLALLLLLTLSDYVTRGPGWLRFG